MKKVLHLNSTFTVNESNLEKGEFMGKEHIIVKDVGSMVSDTVMNGVLYTDKAVKDLANKTTGVVHAPLSHPSDENGDFISAGDPVAIMENFIGAFAFNYRMEDDRLVHDIAIHEETASKTEGGKEVLSRIENKEPIDTSTGLMIYECDEEQGYGNCGMMYNLIAHELELDHDAILISEQGAATNAQGVGFFTNADKKVEVDQFITNANIANTYLKVVDIPYDEKSAIERIKEFTNSVETPSSNYRRFFFEFDKDNIKDFGSYKLPFADIVNGQPVAVKEALVSARELTDKPEVVEMIDAYLLKSPKNNSVGNAWNSIKDFLFGSNKDNTVYDEFYSRLNTNSSDVKYPIEINDDHIIFKNNIGKAYKLCYNKANGDIDFTGEPIEVVVKTNYFNQESDQMKEIILEMLKKAGIETEGMTDEQLLEAYKSAEMPEANAEEAEAEVEVEEEVEANAEDQLKATIKAVLAEMLAGEKTENEEQEEMNAEEAEAEAEEANAEEDKAALEDEVVSMNIGINKKAAKAMNANALNEVITSINSESTVAFNAKGGYNGTQESNSSWELPK